MPINPCDSCAGGCPSCAPWGCPLILTQPELEMLRQFGETPFLPIARTADAEIPIYLEGTDCTPEEYSVILRNLESKGLISLDYFLPLSNFDYAPYAAWPIRGSMALTAAGQDALDALEVQGAEE